MWCIPLPVIFFRERVRQCEKLRKCACAWERFSTGVTFTAARITETHMLTQFSSFHFLSDTHTHSVVCQLVALAVRLYWQCLRVRCWVCVSVSCVLLLLFLLLAPTKGLMEFKLFCTFFYSLSFQGCHHFLPVSFLPFCGW